MAEEAHRYPQNRALHSMQVRASRAGMFYEGKDHATQKEMAILLENYLMRKLTMVLLGSAA